MTAVFFLLRSAVTWSIALLDGKILDLVCSGDSAQPGKSFRASGSLPSNTAPRYRNRFGSDGCVGSTRARGSRANTCFRRVAAWSPSFTLLTTEGRPRFPAVV